ncbi:MAG: DNA gyrase subunit A [Firmicutes bacterium]|nr:DNA gyrase subunit A [Bacillota bacterium]
MEVNTKVIGIDVSQEMRRSYIDYAMSVIVGRALPDVRDGLKPVHRRILYAMHEMGLPPDRPHKKSARVVGEVLGKFHPHGDMAVYEAIVRLAQDFASRYPLVDGHGNFGSVDGDPAAAMRYTEVRLARPALYLLADLEKETVDFTPNFDGSLEEPSVLPARFPNLLVNGSSGIAVGMATNIPPHNLGEVIDGLVAVIDNPETTAKDLMRLIKGPDFPTGGLILGKEGITKAYTTGRGSILMQGVARIEVLKGDRERILITEIPYQVNKARLVEKIADLVRDKKIEGISDLRDESDRTGMRVVVELKRDANANVVLNQLYKHTSLRETFGVIMLALVNGEPKILDLRQLLGHYLDHQKEVVTRRTRFELAKAEARAHILEGLRIALANLDAIIALIKASSSPDVARDGLMQHFGLSEKQAQAILDMRLARLTALEREKIEQEYAELVKAIAEYRAILADERKVYAIIKQEVLEVKEKHADPRRTRIAAAAEEMEMEDLIPEEDVVVTLTHQGYIKRLPLSTYRSQGRGGKGITGLHTREEDFVEQVFVTSTHHRLLFFTNTGKVYPLHVYEVPDASRTSKGTAAVNLIPIERGEHISAVIPLRDFNEDAFLILATAHGVIKKTSLREFAAIRKNGLIAISLDKGDELASVRLTHGHQEILLVSRKGQAIRFLEDEVRSMGRTAHGVKGLGLRKSDRVVGMEVIAEGLQLLIITEKGFGKRLPADEFRPQGRGGLGVKAMTVTGATGPVAGIRMIAEADDVVLISVKGKVIRVPAAQISLLKRGARGVTVTRRDPDDYVVSVARVPGKEIT